MIILNSFNSRAFNKGHNKIEQKWMSRKKHRLKKKKLHAVALSFIVIRMYEKLFLTKSWAT